MLTDASLHDARKSTFHTSHLGQMPWRLVPETSLHAMMTRPHKTKLAKHAYLLLLLEKRVDEDIGILFQLDNRRCCLGLDFLQGCDVQLGSVQRSLQWGQLISGTVQGLDSFPDLQSPNHSWPQCCCHGCKYSDACTIPHSYKTFSFPDPQGPHHSQPKPCCCGCRYSDACTVPCSYKTISSWNWT